MEPATRMEEVYELLEDGMRVEEAKQESPFGVRRTIQVLNSLVNRGDIKVNGRIDEEGSCVKYIRIK